MNKNLVIVRHSDGSEHTYNTNAVSDWLPGQANINGEWRDIVQCVYDSEDTAWFALAEKAPDTLREAHHKIEAARAAQAAADSFDRCDTDGALSQWASGVCSQLDSAKATLAADGGFAVFPVIVDVATGEVVSYKLYTFPNKFGYGTVSKWQVMGRAGSVKAEWVTDYRLPKNFAARGLQKCWMVLPAAAAFRHPLDRTPEPRGLSGCCNLRPVVFPDYEKINF